MELRDPEVRRCLRRASVARIATLSPAGVPLVTPLYFAVGDGRLYCGARRENPAFRNAARDPRVVVLLRAPGARGVLRLRGRAAVHTHGRRFWWILARGSAWKYVLSPGALLHRIAHWRRLGVTSSYYRERRGEGAVLEIVPESAEMLPAPESSAARA